MQAISSREVLIITAAAAGAALSAGWWANRRLGPDITTDVPDRDRVEELHAAFLDSTVPYAASGAVAAHRHRSRLHPLRVASPWAPAATAHRSLPQRSME
ncbi:hypothetical protein ACFQ7I_13275 [Streptomyces massasporeus]